jgi:hypothetical protein
MLNRLGEFCSGASMYAPAEQMMKGGSDLTRCYETRRTSSTAEATAVTTFALNTVGTM